MKWLNLRYLIKKIRRRETASSADLLDCLRRGGAEIGEDVLIYGVSNTMLDKSAPWLLKIGSHVVIGAGSVVTRDCPSGGVYAGNPARRIMSIEEYYHKRKSLQFAEAKEMALCYRQRFRQDPPREVFAEYFMLFAGREEAQANPAFRKKLELLGNYEASIGYMDNHPPMFRDYETFLAACYGESR